MPRTNNIEIFKEYFHSLMEIKTTGEIYTKSADLNTKKRKYNISSLYFWLNPVMKPQYHTPSCIYGSHDDEDLRIRYSNARLSLVNVLSPQINGTAAYCLERLWKMEIFFLMIPLRYQIMQLWLLHRRKLEGTK